MCILLFIHNFTKCKTHDLFVMKICSRKTSRSVASDFSEEIPEETNSRVCALRHDPPIKNALQTKIISSAEEASRRNATEKERMASAKSSGVELT